MSEGPPLPFAVRGVEDDDDVELLLRSLAHGHPPRRILLVGETGTGKSSVAKAFARMRGVYDPEPSEDWLRDLRPIAKIPEVPAAPQASDPPRFVRYPWTRVLLRTSLASDEREQLARAAGFPSAEGVGVARLGAAWRSHPAGARVAFHTDYKYPLPLRVEVVRAHPDPATSVPAFQEVDLSAGTGDMLRSELFGHVEGAFTGALGDREGAIVAAHNGVLFLDEVDSATTEIQANLLAATRVDHFLVRPLGSDRPTKAYPRVVAACCSLRRVREELAFRLGQVVLHLMPLREQRARIPAIAQSWLLRECRRTRGNPREFSAKALDWLLEHSWPGNLRELESLVSNIVFLGAGTGQSVEVRHILRARTFSLSGPHEEAEPVRNGASLTPPEMVALALEQGGLDGRRLGARELEALRYEWALLNGPRGEQRDRMGVSPRTWDKPDWHADHRRVLDSLGRGARVRACVLDGTPEFRAKVGEADARDPTAASRASRT